MPRPLPRRFFARDAIDVAPELVGAHLVVGEVEVRLTEVEAYRPNDSACHAARGRTERNAPMFGPAGTLYVYLCYGIHLLINVVVDAEGVGAAVLLRAAEPIRGLESIRARRGGRDGPTLLDGPGKLGQALSAELGWNGVRIDRPGPVFIHAGTPPPRVATGPRIGIDAADPRDVAAPWRFADADSSWVSHRRRLTGVLG